MDDTHLASVGCRAPWAAGCGPGRYGVGSAVPAVAAASWYASAAAAPATASACEPHKWRAEQTHVRAVSGRAKQYFEATLKRAGRESELNAL